MLFFLVRHGDPIYVPDSLTPLGMRQAEAVAKRLALYGIDEIYTSTSNRAIQTAKPLCELINKEITEKLDFANESHTWAELTTEKDDGTGLTWLFYNKKTVNLFNSPEIRSLGDRWFDHPELKARNYEKGIKRVYDESDAFFKRLGYEHIRYSGKYKAICPSEKRVALFAHQGFGLAFLSCVLDIPYPAFCTHFDIGHTGVTVINFRDFDGISVPKVLTLSSDSHLYREGLPTLYNYEVEF